MSLLFKEFEEVSIHVRKENVKELINLCFAIMVEDLSDTIGSITDSVSHELVHGNERRARELITDLKKSFDKYRESLDYIYELVEENLLLDSLEVASLTVPLDKVYEGSEFSKMIEDAQKERTEYKDTVRKRIKKREKD